MVPPKRCSHGEELAEHDQGTEDVRKDVEVVNGMVDGIVSVDKGPVEKSDVETQGDGNGGQGPRQLVKEGHFANVKKMN